MVEWFFRSDYTAGPVHISETLLGLLLAFVCGQLMAWVYMTTHSGLSYSRTFVNSLVVLPVIVALVMMVLSHNIVTVVGLMTVFAIVRFRNVLRDTLDTTYVFSVIVIGLACGTFRYGTAAVGCGLIAAILLYMSFTRMGTRHRYDYILNLHWDRPVAELGDLRMLLNRHSRKAICASQRSSDTPDGTDFSYRLLLRDPNRIDELLNELRNLPGVSRVSGLTAEDESEM